MRKKILSMILTVLLIFSLAACAGAPGGSDEGLFDPGLYRVTVDGRNGPVIVDVELTENLVKRIEVLDHSESIGAGDVAMKKVAEDLVKKQSFEVDTVSGATISSYAIIKAVSAALNAAGADVEIIKY